MPSVYIGGVIDFDQISSWAGGPLNSGGSGVGLYLHSTAIQDNFLAGVGGQTAADFSGPVGGEAELGLVADPATEFLGWYNAVYLEDGLSPAYANVVGFDVTSTPIAEWTGFVQAANSVGISSVAPIFSPNDISFSLTDFATNPAYETLREAALAGGALTTDAPPAYFAYRGAAYQDFTEQEITWAEANGLRATAIVSPFNDDASFLADTQAFVQTLVSAGAAPTQWVVEDYTPGDTTSPATLEAVAQWLAADPDATAASATTSLVAQSPTSILSPGTGSTATLASTVPAAGSSTDVTATVTVSGSTGTLASTVPAAGSSTDVTATASVSGSTGTLASTVPAAGSSPIVTAAATASASTGTLASTVPAAGSSTGVTATATGSGYTFVTSSGGYDVVNGSGGNDVVLSQGTDTINATGITLIYASGPAATVNGGTAALTFVAGAGSYVAGGGSGTDMLFGGTGSSTLTGSSGTTNFIIAASGNTTLAGGLGSGAVSFGGPGADTFLGSSGGNDTMVGGAGTNVFNPTEGDVVFGGTGAGDSVDGATGSALVVEGSAPTQVTLGTGTLTVFAGSGADDYVLTQGQTGGAEIVGFKPSDLITLQGGFTEADATSSLQGAATGSFGTVLRFADGTSVTLFGASVSANQIILA